MSTIRQLREERGWTQLRLAIRLGVTPVTIYNWERGSSEPRVRCRHDDLNIRGIRDGIC
jgi:transcriptional regulator with XRE-family HTH domain